jgi:uncharacterized RDD family membrane protein YckC
MEPTLDSVQTDLKPVVYGGFWIRFVAYLIDSVILGIVQSIIMVLFFGSMFMNPNPEEMANGLPPSFFGFIIISFAINWIYFALMESSARQGTFGKSALDLKVTDLSGNRISFANATGRYFAKIVSSIILMIGFIMAAFNDKKQSLHDKLAATYVVKK